MTWTWAEPFAGAAACALRLVGGRDLAPPVAWMGGKRRYARAILDAMGVPEGPPSRVLLADAGPWGWVWPLLLRAEDAARVAAVLRSWAGEHPRELWQRLAAVPPAEDVHERAAQWLWLQARSASGVPIWWDGWRHVAGSGKPATDRGEDLRWAGHRAVRAAWRQDDHGTGRDQAACQTGGSWRMGEEFTKSRRDDRTISQTGTAKGRVDMLTVETVAARVEALAASFSGVEWSMHHGDARDLAPRSGAWVYVDPPYSGSPAVVPPASAALLLAPDAGDGLELRAALRAAGLNRLRKPVRHLRVTLAEVLGAVIAESKVLDRVVELVVVDVVDDLVWSEWAAEVALHDQAVLGDCAALVADKPVAVLNPAGPLACASRGGELLPLVGHLRRALAEFYVAAADPAPVLSEALARADVLAGERALQGADQLGATDVALDLVAHRHVTLRGLARQDIGMRHRRPGSPRPTGYGWDMPRAEVLELARRWADAGAVVAVSEAEPLELPGWHHLELTREGGKPEFLTLSRAPVRLPDRQEVFSWL